MKLIIKDGSENYAATVVKVQEFYPIEGADRIKRCVVLGNNVIVPTTTQEGALMVYFVSGTKLNKDYCTENNLLTDAELNKDKKKGYISAKQLRVKAVKLKGVVSNGMLMPLDSLESIGINASKLKEGDSFTDIDDIYVCEKFIVPVKRTSNKNSVKQPKQNKLKEVIVENQFRFHYSTEHLAKNLPEFNAEDIITITRKRHGSSLILSNVVVNAKLSWFEKLLRKIGVDISDKEYGFVWSSGKPKSKLPKGMESATNKWDTPNKSYYSKDIWLRAYHELKDKVEKGISIYAEITGQGIQGADYTYNKEYAIHVYRITLTNLDGQVYELGWEEVKAYCEKYGLDYVEEYFVGKCKEITQELGEQDFDHRDFLAVLQNKYLDKSYPDCKVDEGICIRKNSTNQVFKLKSPLFVLGESNKAEKGEVDLEEAQ